MNSVDVPNIQDKLKTSMWVHHYGCHILAAANVAAGGFEPDGGEASIALYVTINHYYSH